MVENGVCYPGKCRIPRNRFCSDCIDGYYISNGLCRALNCLNFDEYILICLDCKKYYSVESNMGICRPDNCLKYNHVTLRCTKCLPGYSLENGVCRSGD